MAPEENEFDTTPVGAAAEGPATDELADFLQDAQSDTLPEGATFITVRTSGGENKHVPTDNPLTVRDLLSKAGIYTSGAVEYWLNSVKVGIDEIVGIDQTLTVVGSVKGG